MTAVEIKGKRGQGPVARQAGARSQDGVSAESQGGSFFSGLGESGQK